MPAAKRTLSEVEAATENDPIKKLKDEAASAVVVEKKDKKDKKDKTEKKEKKEKKEKTEKKDKSDKSDKKKKKADKEADSGKSTPDDTSSEADSVAESDPNALENFRISAASMANLRAGGIKALFPIQAMTFDHVFDGKDVVGQAKTGSGKTISFGLPIIEKLLANPPQGRGRPPSVIVMAPTRELAKQVGIF
jgi:ATP-dependent RNA helicase DDX21